MDWEKQQKYYEIMEKITDTTCNPDHFSRDEFIASLNEFCDLFRIAKGETAFYLNAHSEQIGQGEIMIDRDNGHGDIEILHRRIAPKTGVIMVGKLYMSKDDEPLTEEEFAKVDLVYRIVMSFIARNRLQKKLYQFAFFDEDNYPNRRAFNRYIAETLMKNEQYNYTAICINLRHFSLINQDLGRFIGDKVLRIYFKLLEDEIGENGIVCRLGGDNFVLFIKNELTDRFLNLFSGVQINYDDNDPEKHISLSARAGVFKVSEKFPLDTPGQIMDKVFPAIQMAKQRGVNVAYYDEEFDAAKDHIQKVRQRFVEGMEKSEFRAFYQPKVDITTGKVVGAEALCRWFRDDRMVMPMEFIPILEMNKDICRLDFHMLKVVCSDIREWLDEGLSVPRISVNLSRKHLSDTDLLDRIIGIIDKYNVPHEYIEIELTETTTDVEFKELSYVVSGLRNAGIHSSVDDFGNGFSSLNLIRSVPWDVLKIDRSLLPTDDEHSIGVTSLYEHVVSIARDMGIQCISEGVETKKQVDLLRRNNCLIAQGFYFAKPMPKEEFVKLLDGTPFINKIN